MNVVSLGEILWDVFPDHRVWGGAPANFTFHTSQFGAEAVMISALGKDNLGRELRETIKNENINLIANEVDAPTGQSIIKVDRNGNPSYDIVQPSAWDFIELNHEAEASIKKADLLCFGTLAQRGEVSQKSIMKAIHMKKKGAKVMFDMNIRQDYYNKAMIEQSLLVTDILKLNELELEIIQALFGHQLEALLSHFELEMMIITMGEHGSRIITEEQNLCCPVYPCHVVDAVGAGDSFGAALIMQVMQGVELSKAQALASRVASYVCEHPGATVSLPSNLKSSFGNGLS